WIQNALKILLRNTTLNHRNLKTLSSLVLHHQPEKASVRSQTPKYLWGRNTMVHRRLRTRVLLTRPKNPRKDPRHPRREVKGKCENQKAMIQIAMMKPLFDKLS